MRHRNKNKILDRKKAARTALLRSLATNLVLYERIKTTEAKAKVLKPIVERLVTKAKKGNLTSRRELMKYLYQDNAIKKILEDLSVRYKDRKGGYLRITKLGSRQGDAAKVAHIEFV